VIPKALQEFLDEDTIQVSPEKDNAVVLANIADTVLAKGRAFVFWACKWAIIGMVIFVAASALLTIIDAFML
jgi:hypothetical protein